jgi:Amt family ammonium transporter
LAANGTAAAIFLNTLVAGCLGMLGWLSVEQIRDGRPTTFGAASGVVGVHFVGGVVGVSLIGLLATAVMTSGPQGLFYGGGFAQLGKQALAIVVVALYAFTVSLILAKLIDRVMGFRLSAEDETTGVDVTQHAETAYAEGVHGHLPQRGPGLGER